MFTGLIEAIGEVAAITPASDGFRLRIRTGLATELSPGDSLAVNGVCLTVIAPDADGLFADISPETARVTALGTLSPGSRVNLERPLRADGRIGGHFVQGHVDAVGAIDAIQPTGDAFRLTIRYPSALAPFIVRKGSIAINGISLTVADSGDRRLDVQIIPFTWEHTTLSGAKPGDPVNIEVDILGKYAVRAAELAGLTTNPGTAP